MFSVHDDVLETFKKLKLSNAPGAALICTSS